MESFPDSLSPDWRHHDHLSLSSITFNFRECHHHQAMADHPMPPSNAEPSTIISEAVLTQILAQLDSLTISNQVLNAKVSVSFFSAYILDN
jgi:hypothetical protein